MLFLHQYTLLIGAAMVTGIGNALLIPALSTIYLGATAEQNRSQVMGIQGTAISLGTLLGPLVQALASPWITSQMTFAMGIALSFVITLLAFVVLPDGKKSFQTISFDANTTIEGGKATLKAGVHVQVEVLNRADGSLYATEVKRSPREQGNDEGVDDHESDG
jgi:MFS family permease